jgi:hypothetical protein
MQETKPDTTVQMIKVWERSYLTISQKKTINQIIETLTVTQSVENDLKSLIRSKISERSVD